MKHKSESQFRQALGRFKKNRLSVLCLRILMTMYVFAIFAGFLAPYHFENEQRTYSYAPPTPIHIFNKHHKLTRPFIYERTFVFDEYHKRIYKENHQGKSYALKLFVRGDDYKFWGIYPTNIHLFGVDDPGRLYLLGSDSRGRDMFSRLIYGARISLSIAIIGVSISFSLGLLIGGTAGYYGGKIDHWMMRGAEMFMLIPGFYLMLALIAIIPDGFNSFQRYLAITIVFSFIGWAGLARIIRGMSISLRERDYVLAAKAMGLSDLRIIVTHVLPHTVSYSIVAIMLAVPGYILGEASLSLIGLGIQDPIPSWGNLLSDAMSIAHIKLHPWILIPGFVIFLTVICFNMIGDALRDCLDPLLKGESH